VRPLAVDEQVGGYKILGTAGVGGMGIVYKALDLKLNRTVALKFLPNDLNVASKDKERFLQEARTASALDHSNIGVIHGLEETADGQTFIVMAYYEGLTLAERIRRGPMSPKEALEIMVQITRGLIDAHEHSIIHRDIKPSNVIITRQNVAKIVDFGLARVASNAATTLTAGPVGTLAYMSPEQVRNEPLDRRTDIWSLGVVFDEMLTGKHPFERGNTRFSVHALAGGALVDGAVPINTTDYYHGWLTRFSYAAGGGVEHALSETFGVRVQADYLHSAFFDAQGAVRPQGSLRLTVSLVLRRKMRQESTSE